MSAAPQSRAATQEDDSLETMSPEDGWRLLDHQARKFLGMSGEEFARQYRAGLIENPHRLEVVRVAILLPLAEL
jgi:hypothetical protein